jgi:hypothetical protein
MRFSLSFLIADVQLLNGGSIIHNSLSRVSDALSIRAGNKKGQVTHDY